jgi:hypothetical protein
MFRELGRYPANEISAHAAAAIVGLPVAQAKQLLDQLLDAHMVEQRRPDRYELHDLLRLYAAEEARRAESVAGGDRASRLFDECVLASLEWA